MDLNMSWDIIFLPTILTLLLSHANVSATENQKCKKSIHLLMF